MSSTSDVESTSEFKMPDDPFANHKFVTPATKIQTVADMMKWTKSQGYNDFMGFLLTLNNAAKGKSLSADCKVSQPVEKLLELLKTLSSWVDEIPPIEQNQRFGNKAFRTWIQKLKSNSTSLVEDLLPPNLKKAAKEVGTYLGEAFGNETRIDYGTGHEAAFLAFLCCLYKIKIFTPDDRVAIVTKVFGDYLTLSRKLQKTYRMEPAGSQGVWGLDDFQFLPFIFGSSQLMMNENIQPNQFLDPMILRNYSREYMFLECIQYINEVKSGPFAEHSNTLYSITSVPHWTKVNSGLIKMYKAEVLQKFPVIQHFLFGSILNINPHL